MNEKEFEETTKKLSKLIVGYMQNAPQLNLVPTVKPGFLENNIEVECPPEGSHLIDIMRDVEKIMEGVTHRVSPHIHSELPMGNSYASMVGEILTAGINNVSLNWEASPAATELEVVVLNWLAKMINIPEVFHLKDGNAGGGVLQNTCTESSLLSLLSASERCIDQHCSAKNKNRNNTLIRKMIFYSSTLAKSSAELVSRITTIQVRHLVPDSSGKITSDILKTAFEEDIAKGFIPLLYISTMGTNSLMSYDNLTEIGPICQEYNVWLHVDAGYSGMSLICPELRAMSEGLEYADSIMVGLHHLLLTHDVVAYWIKEGALLTAALSVDPLYLRHKHVGSVHDYMNWQVGTGRKFKALKIWMTMKSYGVEGMQEVVRKQVKMADRIEELVTKDNRFEVVACHIGVFTFRLRQEPGNDKNQESRELLEKINKNGKISLAKHEIAGKFCLQFIANQNMEEKDVDFAWEEIKQHL